MGWKQLYDGLRFAHAYRWNIVVTSRILRDASIHTYRDVAPDTRAPLRKALPPGLCYCCDLMKCYARSPAITFPLRRLTLHSPGLISQGRTVEHFFPWWSSLYGFRQREPLTGEFYIYFISHFGSFRFIIWCLSEKVYWFSVFANLQNIPINNIIQMIQYAGISK